MSKTKNAFDLMMKSSNKKQKVLNLNNEQDWHVLEDKDWNELLKKQFEKPYFKKLMTYVNKEFQTQTIYPPKQDVFHAFNHPLNDLRVVIVGQDPYHGENQAHGLAFSVKKGVKIPPSLRNIYKECAANYPKTFKIPNHGNLEKWSNQGVFLLNTVLTVRKGQPNSHKKQGWETFTDSCITELSKNEKNLVFLLWGKPAQKKEELIHNKQNHLIIKTSHPSPLGATKTDMPFIGSKCFLRTNEYLKKHNVEEIDWTI